MAENLTVSKTNKKEKYEELLPQLKSLVDGETDLIANLANISSALKMSMDFFWVGFYLVKNNELLLGPFQGSIACTRIQPGKGVCGTAWQTKQTQIVPDVDEFPGHIACSSLAKSEIVIPILKENQVIAVLDVDSDKLNDFDHTDAFYLEQICTWISDFSF